MIQETHEEELELLLSSDPQSSFTKMKKQLCIVNTNGKSESFIQQLNPLPGISQSSKSSITMGKKRGKITSPLSEGIDTPVLGSHFKRMECFVRFSLRKRMKLRAPRRVLSGKVGAQKYSKVRLPVRNYKGKHIKSGLVGYHIDDDDRMFCNDGFCLRKQTWSMA
ncbi:hypothetical protein Tco_1171922 [Tanacetum coccineum]